MVVDEGKGDGEEGEGARGGRSNGPYTDSLPLCSQSQGGGRRGVGWLVGWLLPLCPGARPVPPRLQATGGRGCVTRCNSHEPRALGLARVAPARSRRFSSYV